MQERQIKILDAVISLLARKGLAHLTHRAVDEAASLPQGSTTYYFSKKLSLIEAAGQRLAALLAQDCSDVKQRFAELVAEGRTDDAIDFVADDLLKYADEAAPLLLARFELTLAGARDPALKSVVERLSQVAREPVAFFLKLLDADVTQLQIDTCMGILDGLTMIAATGQGPKPSRAQIRRLFLTV